MYILCSYLLKTNKINYLLLIVFFKSPDSQRHPVFMYIETYTILQCHLVEIQKINYKL